MEAVLDKRPVTITGRWTPRLFRLKDRRLMYFKKEVTDFEKAIDSQAKYILDLTHLISLSINKKHDLVFSLKHPMLDLELRFKTNELFMSWLKVLASFSDTSVRNGPKIETSIPSNYLYAIWNILQSLYSHPSLTKVEGIFRISGNKAERSIIFNNLLQQTYDVQKLQNHANIHILANVLSALLSNLPSTIFKESQLGHLILFYEAISNRVQDKNATIANMFKKQKANNENADQDVAKLSIDILNRLKAKIEDLYFADDNRSRYGIMTLIFHLLKQIVIHQQRTRMTAENISRIFVHILEAKIFLIKCTDPIQMYRMQYLLKTLIYHAYFIFPQQKWDIEDIVIASKGEIAMIYKIYQLRNKRKIKTPSSKPQSVRSSTRKFVSTFTFPEEEEEEERKVNEDVMSVISVTRTERLDGSKKRPTQPRKSHHTRYNSDTAVLRRIPAQFTNDLVVPSTSALPEDNESVVIIAHAPRKKMPHKALPRKPLPNKPLPNNKPLPQAPRSMENVRQWKRNHNGYKNNNGYANKKKSNNNSHPSFQLRQMQAQGQGASLQNIRRHRAGGITKQQQKKGKRKKKRKAYADRKVHKSDLPVPPPCDVPPPPPPPPPLPPLAGPSLFHMVKGDAAHANNWVFPKGMQRQKRQSTIITPSVSCCTLLGCSCTKYIEGIGPFSKGCCMFCNHSIEDHRVKIWR